MHDLIPTLSISAVERETGLSKDVLRKWEARYGFPQPLRDAFGERIYPAEQVKRLRLIKRLMDRGMRPSSIVGKDLATLQNLASTRHVAAQGTRDTALESRAVALLRRHDPEGLRQTLYRMLLRQGLARFVQDTISPLNHAVGEAWARGELETYEEHLYTEAVQWVLRNALAALNDRQGRPRVLLTTLPEEPHGLGILMVAALLALEEAYCVTLGPQTPIVEIVNAVNAQASDIVVLSFSIIYPPRRIPPALAELRQRLAPAVEIWAGGAATARLSRSPAGTRLLPTLQDALSALVNWRSNHAGLLSSGATTE